MFVAFLLLLLSSMASVKAIYGVCILLWGYGGLVPQTLNYDKAIPQMSPQLNSALEAEGSTQIWHQQRHLPSEDLQSTSRDTHPVRTYSPSAESVTQ